MTISEPKFHDGQYVFYDGDVCKIYKLVGYLPKTDLEEPGWYYEIYDSNGKREMVIENLLTGDLNTEYDRLQRKVSIMEQQLNDMLKRYQNYLSKVDELIRSRE